MYAGRHTALRKPLTRLFRPRRHPFRATARLGLNLVVVVALLALAGLAVGPRTGEYRTLTMLTGSMRPHYPPGSVVLVTAEKPSSLRPGQVVTFVAPTEDRRVVTHRVVSVRYAKDGRPIIETKGDANNGKDPWGEALVTDDTVWRARAAVPYAGRAIVWLRQPRVRVLLVWALPAVLLAWILASVWRPDADA